MPNYVLDSSAANANTAINKVVAITSTPTAGNANTVTSGGVKTYVDNAVAAVQSDVDGITKTVNGVTTTKAVVFTKSFESTDQVLSGDSVTVQVAHGLGAIPFMFQAYYKCHIANNGYTAGELVCVSTINEGHQVSYFADATNIGIRAQNDHHIVDKDGGGYINITSDSSNWRIVFRAFL